MNMEIKVVSRKMITPSNLNHDHPLNVKLSSFDQLSPPMYYSFVFYYHSESSNIMKMNKAQRLQMLEKSLADTLREFYLLAGRYMEESFSIECNDQGVEFSEAQVDGSLANLLLQQPVDVMLASRFAPPLMNHSPSTPLLFVQASLFECGGIAIGLRVSHIVADMHSITYFCNTWAAACKSSASSTSQGLKQLPHLLYERDGPAASKSSASSSTSPFVPPKLVINSSMFPPRGDMSAPRQFVPSLGGPSLDTVTKRFVFNGKSLSRLKLASGRLGASRVQALTALIWRIMIKMDGAKHGRLRSSVISHVFNARNKGTNLPIPDNSFGNLYWSILARFTPDSNSNMDGVEARELVGVVREALECAKSSVQACEDYEDMFLVARKAWRDVREASELMEEVDYACHFSSWCRMGHYEVNFGWGNPIWVSSQHIPIDGFVTLLDSRDGEGIEAWVSLHGNKMLLFQQDPEIIAFTS